MRNIDKKWRLLAQGDITADSLVVERISKYPPEPLRISSQQPPVRVQANNSASPLCTILEISTADNFGLLHKIVRCLSENRVNIVSARLSTRIDQAVDVFPAKQVIPTVFENIQSPISGRNDGNVEGSPAEVKY